MSRASYYAAERFLVPDAELARARLALLQATRQVLAELAVAHGPVLACQGLGHMPAQQAVADRAALVGAGDDDLRHLDRPAEGVREGLRRALEREPDVEVVAEAASVSEGVAMGRKSEPTVAIVDLRLPDGNGLDVIAELSRVRPSARASVCGLAG